MKEAINATIQRILRTDRGITANQVLVDDLGFDSLKLFQLITELEDEFDIAISFRDAQNIKTVGDVYTSVAVWFPETAKPAPSPPPEVTVRRERHVCTLATDHRLAAAPDDGVHHQPG